VDVEPFLGHSLAKLGNFQVLTSFIRQLMVGSHPKWKTKAVALRNGLQTLTDSSSPLTQ